MPTAARPVDSTTRTVEVEAMVQRALESGAAGVAGAITLAQLRSTFEQAGIGPAG